MRTCVEDLFHEVADLPEEAAEDYFAARDIDAATLKEVRALLEFDSSESVSIERDIGRVADRALARLEPKEILCGPYRLGHLLGRGGMGTVYLADRIDGEVAHQAAVKLLRPGADEPALRRRF